MHMKDIFYAAAVLLFLFMPPPQVSGGQSPVPDPAKLSAEEKEWFETFQRGTFFAPGWREITAALLAKAPYEFKSGLRQTLDLLGNRIGCEWSRDNDIRRIDSDMIAQWGDMLRQAAAGEPEQIPQVVANLNRQVLTLLD